MTLLRYLALTLFSLTVTSSFAKLPPGAEHWEAECTQGQAKSCLFFGYRIMNGDEIEQDYKRAVHFLAKSCQLGLAQGCHEAGLKLYFGKGNLPESLPQALPYLTKACKDYPKTKQSCYYAAWTLAYAQGVETNPASALYYANVGCRAQHGQSCGLGGHLLLRGKEGVSTDLEKALIYLQAGCTLEDAFSCYHLAMTYGYADFSDQDKAQALTFAQKANKLEESPQHNYLVGSLLAEKSEYTSSIPYFKKSCEAKMSEGCRAVGNSIQYAQGSLTEAENWYKQGCALNDPLSCEAQKDLRRYMNELEEYERQMAAYRAQEARNQEGANQVSAALNAGDFNRAMEIATYGLGSRAQAARVIIAAENAGRIGQLDPLYIRTLSNWFVFEHQNANGIVQRELRNLVQAEKRAQNSYRVAPVARGPQAPSTLYDQVMKFQKDSYKANMDWYNRGGNPSDPRVYQ